ncbi:hypothetical protein [Aureimonas sp. SA4125]|uniref:hypothetical protein n=1 Tax=Aureimonas sp. SA4125 TaxID=2826993 RepID=UPI001CC653C0|nr:hypothetical protein [Aureimonas sp. SA4125]
MQTVSVYGPSQTPRDTEIDRLRRALYEPSEFSIELFGQEAADLKARSSFDRSRRGSLMEPLPPPNAAAVPRSSV